MKLIVFGYNKLMVSWMKANDRKNNAGEKSASKFQFERGWALGINNINGFGKRFASVWLVRRFWPTRTAVNWRFRSSKLNSFFYHHHLSLSLSLPLPLFGFHSKLDRWQGSHQIIYSFFFLFLFCSAFFCSFERNQIYFVLALLFRAKYV